MKKSPCIAVIGTQWGDEGKGKVVDYFAENATHVVRYMGGANAGHTVKVGEKEYKLHLLPSGIIRNGVNCLLGPGVVCDLPKLVNELEIAKQHGSLVLLDKDAAVILDWHKSIDAIRDKMAGIGTTKKGIGPCYEDVYARRSLRLKDLLDARDIDQVLSAPGFFEEKQAVANSHDRDCVLSSIHSLIEQLVKVGQKIKTHICDTREVLHRAINNEGNLIVFEGAQGLLIDIWLGTWPYVTSSCPGLSGIVGTLGVTGIDQVVGVAKAYLTRVGSGPFPTELRDETGAALREKGGEYGTTTGRPRRCGWLDLVALKYACRMGGITKLVVTKLDVLSGFDTLQVCTKYVDLHGSKLRGYATLTAEVMESYKPFYAPVKGWDQDISGCSIYEDLPELVRSYLGIIEKYTGVEIIGAGVGPARDQYIPIKSLIDG